MLHEIYFYKDRNGREQVLEYIEKIWNKGWTTFCKTFRWKNMGAETIKRQNIFCGMV